MISYIFYIKKRSVKINAKIKQTVGNIAYAVKKISMKEKNVTKSRFFVEV